MKVNDWSSVDLKVPQALNEKEEKFLNWLRELAEDQYGWTYQVALLSLHGLDVSEIARRVGCTRTTVQRKQKIIAELRQEFEKDYWWL